MAASSGVRPAGRSGAGRALAPAFALRRYRAIVKYRVNGVPAALTVAVDPDGGAGGGALVEGESSDLALALRLERAVPAGNAAAAEEVVVTTAITARRDGVELDLVEPLELTEPGAPAAALRFLHNGWQSWSGTSALAGDDREPRPPAGFLRELAVSPWAPRTRGRAHLSSELFTAAAAGAGGPAVALGYLGGASQFGGFELRGGDAPGPRLAARLPFEGVPLRRGETRHGEPLLVQWGEDASAMLETWASRVGGAMRARVAPRRTVGWCSWYEFFTRVDEAAIGRNFEAALRLRDRLPLDLLQIDDGYQPAIGDWLDANAKFPRGMAPIAWEIAERGFTPGLWLAPFIARPESELAREHPGWMLRDAVGRPRRGVFNPAWGWRDSAHALDLTHPGALEWLADTARRIVRELGYRFLKLDFLFAAALPGRRRDPRCTGAEALRRGLETIRAAVGDDVHLLGCGCPLGPAIGVVDSMRIGADVAPYWRDPLSRVLGRDYDFPATRNALRNTIARAFLHGRLWRNDPDCLLVRDRRTRLTRDEVLALATVVAVSGGTFLLSDELSDLAGERLEIAQRALAVQADLADEPPVALDPLAPGFSRLLLARCRAGGAYLAVLNPSDFAETIALRLDGEPAVRRILGGAVSAAREVWTDAVYDVAAGRLDLGRVPPHAARLLRLSAAP